MCALPIPTVFLELFNFKIYVNFFSTPGVEREKLRERRNKEQSEPPII